MDVTVEGRGALEADADCVAFGVFAKAGKEVKFPSYLGAADAATGGLLTAAWERGEIQGKKGEVTFHPLPGGRRRVVLIGLGKRERFSVESVRVAAGYLAKHLKGKGAVRLAAHLPTFSQIQLDAATSATAVLDGLTLGSYEFTRYRSEKDSATLTGLVVSLGKEHIRSKRSVENAVSTEAKVLDTVLWTRDVGNLPADVATPEYVASEAIKLAAGRPIKVTVFDEAKLKELGCGGILAVGSGSTHPPRLVIMDYAGRGPAKGGRKQRIVALVGKGITFDSGGISIKPSANMAEMKFDKSGAVAVMGTLRAISDLGVPERVIGVMSLAENLPSGSSYRPGDVVKSFSGKTIEILNTDAEGRVVLSDALAYVNTTYHPDEIIDLATLTGACVVALGNDTAALLSTDEGLATRLLASSEATGERLWRMPLTDTHREMVKSDVADVKNSVELPVAGTLTAGAFLSAFVGTTPWAHLDIAGTAWVGKVGGSYAPPYTPPGNTAFGVRLLVHYLSKRN